MIWAMATHVDALPVILMPFRNHATLGSGLPVARQENVTLSPTVTFFDFGFSFH